MHSPQVPIIQYMPHLIHYETLQKSYFWLLGIFGLSDSHTAHLVAQTTNRPKPCPSYMTFPYRSCLTTSSDHSALLNLINCFFSSTPPEAGPPSSLSALLSQHALSPCLPLPVLFLQAGQSDLSVIHI